MVLYEAAWEYTRTDLRQFSISVPAAYRKMDLGSRLNDRKSTLIHDIVFDKDASMALVSCSLKPG